MAKVVPRRKCITLNTQIRKEEKSKMNNLSLHIRKVEKKGQIYSPEEAEEK